MREMFKEPTTWLLIILILGASLIGGLEQKKTVETNDQIEIVNK